MAKPTLDKAQAKQNLVEPRTKSNGKFELNKELLKEVRNNAYSGRVEEDVISHIAKFLKILDLIKITNVEPFELWMKAFLISLAGDAKKWWVDEGIGKIHTWEELVKKFFGKFYPRSCASNYDKMCDDDEEGCDPLEFITRMNLKFKDHKKLDDTTKRTLLYSWIEDGNNNGLMNDVASSDEEWEESDYGNPANANIDSPAPCFE
ncbi:hypothetical protein Tco_0152635 [Tanacetum coccineum]